jgi:hypothetical protein
MPGSQLLDNFFKLEDVGGHRRYTADGEARNDIGKPCRRCSIADAARAGSGAAVHRPQIDPGRPQSPILQAADEFIAQHPELLQRLAQ